MNYNNMAGAPPAGLPNGHHPMPSHPPTPVSMGSEDPQQIPSQADPSSDPYHHQQMGVSSQYSNQQHMK